jgi:hypothetical protein
MVRHPEFLFNEVNDFLGPPWLISLELLPQVRTLPVREFRGSPAAVVRREFADAAVVPPRRPPRAGRLGLALATGGFAEGITLVEILDEPEPSNHLRVLFVPKFGI